MCEFWEMRIYYTGIVPSAQALETKEVKLQKNPRKSMIKLTQTQMKVIRKVAGYNKVKSQ